MPLNTEQLLKSTSALLDSQKQATIQLQTPCCQECSEYRNVSWKHGYHTSCTFNSCFESFQSLHHQNNNQLFYSIEHAWPSTKLLDHICTISQTCCFLVVLKICLYLGNQALPSILNISEIKKLLEKGSGNRYAYRTQEEIKAKPQYLIYTCDSWVLKGQPPTCASIVTCR